MENTNEIRQRDQIPVEDKWAIEDLYPTDEAWEQELATIAEDQAKLASFAGHLADSAESLLHYLTAMEQVMVQASKPAKSFLYNFISPPSAFATLFAMHISLVKL